MTQVVTNMPAPSATEDGVPVPSASDETSSPLAAPAPAIPVLVPAETLGSGTVASVPEVQPEPVTQHAPDLEDKKEDNPTSSAPASVPVMKLASPEKDP